MNRPHLVGLVGTEMVPAELKEQVIPCGAIAAAIRTAPSGAAEHDRRDHHAAVVFWCRRTNFLPSRANLAISPQLLQSVTQSAGCYRERLAQIAGRVEISVEYDRCDSLPRRTTMACGRAYLRQATDDLIACEAATATAAKLLAMFTDQLGADLVVRCPQLPSIGLRAAVLARRADAPRLAKKIESTLNMISTRLACRVTGPWPPYSFSTIEEPS